MPSLLFTILCMIEHSQRLSGQSQTIIIIVIITIYELLLIYLTELIQLICVFRINSVYVCARVGSYATHSLYICTFVVPLSLLSYLYSCIGLKLWRRQMPGNVDAHRDLNMQTQRVKVSPNSTISSKNIYISIEEQIHAKVCRGLDLLLVC